MCLHRVHTLERFDYAHARNPGQVRNGARGATNSTLKNVYQHTFSEERKQVDEMIDRYFEEALNKEDTLNEPEE